MIFHIAERQRETNVHQNRKADYLTARFNLAKGRVFCRPIKIRNHPTWPKPVSSDNAANRLALQIPIDVVERPKAEIRKLSETPPVWRNWGCCIKVDVYVVSSGSLFLSPCRDVELAGSLRKLNVKRPYGRESVAELNCRWSGFTYELRCRSQFFSWC